MIIFLIIRIERVEKLEDNKKAQEISNINVNENSEIKYTKVLAMNNNDMDPFAMISKKQIFVTQLQARFSIISK